MNSAYAKAYVYVILNFMIPTSRSNISDWVENVYKGPYVHFCDLHLLSLNFALFCCSTFGLIYDFGLVQ